MIPVSNEEQDQTTYKNDNFGFFLLLELFPLLAFEFDLLSYFDVTW